MSVQQLTKQVRVSGSPAVIRFIDGNSQEFTPTMLAWAFEFSPRKAKLCEEAAPLLWQPVQLPEKIALTSGRRTLE